MIVFLNSFQDDRNVLYFDCSVGYVGAYICQNSWSPTLKMSAFNIDLNTK